jgi:hypothetical protein
VILGGVHADFPIEPTSGELVADLVVDGDENVIIDISRNPDGTMWSIGERIRFVTAFAKRLYQRQGEKRRPIKLVIDEAARFAPQIVRSGDVDVAKCMGAVAVIVEEGRNVGIGVTLVTQRSARAQQGRRRARRLHDRVPHHGPELDARRPRLARAARREGAPQRHQREGSRPADRVRARGVAGLARVRGHRGNAQAPDVRLVGDAQARPGPATEGSRREARPREVPRAHGRDHRAREGERSEGAQGSLAEVKKQLAKAQQVIESKITIAKGEALPTFKPIKADQLKRSGGRGQGARQHERELDRAGDRGRGRAQAAARSRDHRRRDCSWGRDGAAC